MKSSLLDIAKGICIISVVLGHAGIFSRFLYFFHLPVFFFVNALTIRTQYSPKEYIVKRIKTLYIPYVVIMFICAVVFDFKNLFHLKYILKIILFDGDVPGLGAMWFIPCLFINNVIAFFIFKYVKSQKAKIAVVFSFLCVAIIVCKYKPIFYYYIHLIPYIQLIYCIAFFIDLDMVECFFSDKPRAIIFFVISFSLLIILYVFTNIQIDLVNFKVVHPMLWIFLLYIDICFVMSLSSLLKNIQLLKKIGASSFYIMALHFLCFGLINIVGMTIRNGKFEMDNFYIYTILFTKWKWLYAFLGIGIPCGIKLLIQRGKHE